MSRIITPPIGVASQDLPGSASELDALQTVVRALSPFSVETRQRIFDTAATFLGLAQPTASGGRSTTTPASVGLMPRPPYSDDTSMSPKDFLLDKQPQTDVERVASLAYYLTHYREQPNFKTLDISKLNTEAAQPKFSNPAYAVNNAVKRGYLVPATKGSKQISAAGERFVLALPDRAAARQAMAAARPRHSRRRSRSGPPNQPAVANSEP